MTTIFPSELDPVSGLAPVDDVALARDSLDYLTPSPETGNSWVAAELAALLGPIKRYKRIPPQVQDAAKIAAQVAPPDTALDPRSGLPALDRKAVVEGRWFAKLARQRKAGGKRRRRRR